jgi:hypothetical protein
MHREDSIAVAADWRRRQPVWTALSELWLDTALAAADLERIARVALDSGYSLEELEDISLCEVAPVVSGNLRVPAGVWQLGGPTAPRT